MLLTWQQLVVLICMALAIYAVPYVLRVNFPQSEHSGLARWYPEAEGDRWELRFVYVFNGILTQSLLSFWGLVRVALFSLGLSLSLYCVFVWGFGLLDPTPVTTPELFGILPMVLALNVGIDSLCWALTRFMIDRQISDNENYMRALSLILIFCLVALISFFSLGLVRISLGLVPLSLTALAGVESFYSIAFYTSFAALCAAFGFAVASGWQAFVPSGAKEFWYSPKVQIGMLAAVLVVMTVTLLSNQPANDPLQNADCENAPRPECGTKAPEPSVFASISPACQAGDLTLCFTLLNNISSARSAPSSPEWILRCDQSAEQSACFAAGHAFENGFGVIRSDVSARRYYAKACSDTFPDGCNNLAVLLENGRGGTEDAAGALRLYLQACEAGFPTACTNAGTLYETGQTGEKNFEQALSLYERACAQEDGAGCVNAGFMLQHGLGQPVNQAAAVARYQSACDAGHVPGCTNAGYVLATQSDPDQSALGLFLRSCERRDTTGCINAGLAYQKGFEGQLSAERAKELFDRACFLGSAAGCKLEADITLPDGS